jgi:hypothetical protein
MASQWFYKVMAEEVGPVSITELRELAQRGAIVPDTLVANAPGGSWVPAERVRGLFPASITAPPPLNTPPPPPPVSASPRRAASGNDLAFLSDRGHIPVTQKKRPLLTPRKAIAIGLLGFVVTVAGVLAWTRFGRGPTMPDNAVRTTPDSPLTYQEAVALYENELAAYERSKQQYRKDILTFACAEAFAKAELTNDIRKRDRLRDELLDLRSREPAPAGPAAEYVKYVEGELQAVEPRVKEDEKEYASKRELCGAMYKEAFERLKPSIRRVIRAAGERERLDPSNRGKQIDSARLDEQVTTELMRGLTVSDLMREAIGGTRGQ